MPKKIKVGFVSLGCSKNRIDTEVMLHTLLEAGYEVTGDETEADVVIINTCAFIESAKKEAIDNILDIAWLKENKDLKGIVVCGCLAERYRDELLCEMKKLDMSEICPHASIVNEENVRKWHYEGFNVRAWGVSNEEIMKKVYDAGADGMTVNFPDKLVEYMKKS